WHRDTGFSVHLSVEGPAVDLYIERMITTSLPSRDRMYRALTERDGTFDGVFFAAIRTTGIFCRPTCSARKPRPENVEFYPSVRDALGAGYRPCLRCQPLTPEGAAPRWIERLLHQVDRDPSRRWKDEDLRAANLDPARVRRWFLRHHGVTFQAYQRARRLGLAFSQLQEGEKWEGVAYSHGFESASGFHEAFSRTFETPPNRVAAVEEFEPVVITRLLTPLGPMLAGATGDGVCLLEFADRRMLETQLERVRKWFGRPTVPGSNPHIEQLKHELDSYFTGALRKFTVPLLLKGTDFQVAAWTQLMEIPYGETISYERQARSMGRAGAQRAVGKANGDNRMAIIIPCHRVVRQNGELCGYGGGLWRKKFLLDLEQKHLRSDA
ncbi:MAG TPA: methylated-DNA--[protein]-cysteine S-methyltransferase, partial [Gemmatimonadaceae bacterium]|nr:methylated-DNA--[protein]-cysteine S-methyltransferase [Gemmatimonadaceae bacterium]